ncbi:MULTISPECIES: glycoside hydrolase family 3 C-terminal domain-containing protein [unclassified Flavobacterium]|jgi:beta-glucosidase|uniref:glycoside hydrolase family 3 C-terminal domain-containing protein n=1 Tax=unclassified Flavobacterium TaxID=196869 RepID=UPI0025B90C90|nr:MULTISPECIES: glycoside hydrolase family 3 C-terminal domain-containing protein [unclassified Flavobacterium]
MKFTFKFFLTIYVSLCTLSISAQNGNNNLPQLGKNSIKDVIAAMTLDEKVRMVVGPNYSGATNAASINTSEGIIGFTERQVPGAAGLSYAIPRLGIPSLVMADGPAGVRISPIRKGDSINTYYATGFPVGNLLASTWNPIVVKKVGEAFGNEVLEYGIDIILAPGVNIQRNPLNGRNFEYYSEDPLVTGKTATAIIQGIQSNGVGTSLKHLAANNSENNRMRSNSIVSERALREIYLKTFQMTVRDANPWTVMTSYNKLNGTFTAERKDLIINILRNEWEFKGFVVTDWGAGQNYVEQILAGNSLIMPGRLDQINSILNAVKDKKMDESLLDERIEKLLNVVLLSPTFRKYQYSDKPDLVAHAAVSRQAATEGMVLLKNNNQTLPFAKTAHKIAAFGNTSYDLIAGGTGSGDVNKAYIISMAQGLKKADYTLDKNLENLYLNYLVDYKAKQPKPKNAGAGRPQIPELELSKEQIIEQANNADIAIITIGKNAGEGSDRNLENNYNLMPAEKELIKQVSAAFKSLGKKTVVVLNLGGVIDMAGWKDDVDAILLAWQPGQEGGYVIADLLSGKVNPSGKLAITFPETYTDVPSSKSFPKSWADQPDSLVYHEGIYVGYRYYDTYKIKPAYEFGYGLSYTQFIFDNLKLSSTKFNKQITAIITVKNSGSVAGKEVVQLYISAPAKSIDKPTKELKAFAKTNLLQPGESQTLKFSINAEDLASYIPSKAAWIAEAGEYSVQVGVSSRNIIQRKNFSLAKSIITEKVTNQVQPLYEIKDELRGI